MTIVRVPAVVSTSSVPAARWSGWIFQWNVVSPCRADPEHEVIRRADRRSHPVRAARAFAAGAPRRSTRRRDRAYRPRTRVGRPARPFSTRCLRDRAGSTAAASAAMHRRRRRLRRFGGTVVSATSTPATSRSPTCSARENNPDSAIPRRHDRCAHRRRPPDRCSARFERRADRRDVPLDRSKETCCIAPTARVEREARAGFGFEQPVRMRRSERRRSPGESDPFQRASS